MKNNSSDFSMQEAMRLAQSDAGQQLLAMFARMDSAKQAQAAAQAEAGDYAQLKHTLAELLSSPQAQTLIRQMEGK